MSRQVVISADDALALTRAATFVKQAMGAMLHAKPRQRAREAIAVCERLAGVATGNAPAPEVASSRRPPRCAKCGYLATQVIHDTTWAGAHPFEEAPRV